LAYNLAYCNSIQTFTAIVENDMLREVFAVLVNHYCNKIYEYNVSY